MPHSPLRENSRFQRFGRFRRGPGRFRSESVGQQDPLQFAQQQLPPVFGQFDPRQQQPISGIGDFERNQQLQPVQNVGQDPKISTGVIPPKFIPGQTAPITETPGVRIPLPANQENAPVNLISGETPNPFREGPIIAPPRPTDPFGATTGQQPDINTLLALIQQQGGNFDPSNAFGGLTQQFQRFERPAAVAPDQLLAPANQPAPIVNTPQQRRTTDFGGLPFRSGAGGGGGAGFGAGGKLFQRSRNRF